MLEAAVHAERHRQREGALGESRDGLRPPVVVELEIVRAQTGDRLSGTIGHGGVHLDRLHSAREPRRRLFLRARQSRRRPGSSPDRQ